jgi:hypothetical protein
LEGGVSQKQKSQVRRRSKMEDEEKGKEGKKRKNPMMGGKEV